jgi:hypothetical protein
MIESLSKLDQVLDAAMNLPLDQQEMLIQILKNRIVENRRDEIARDAAVSKAELKAGNLKALSSAEAIQELRSFLTDPSIADA